MCHHFQIEFSQNLSHEFRIQSTDLFICLCSTEKSKNPGNPPDINGENLAWRWYFLNRVIKMCHLYHRLKVLGEFKKLQISKISLFYFPKQLGLSRLLFWSWNASIKRKHGDFKRFRLKILILTIFRTGISPQTPTFSDGKLTFFLIQGFT